MSNETKRDVFDAVWNRLAGYQVFFNGWPRETLYDYKKRYDNALPDDLPVIPKAVGEILQSAHGQTTLLGVLDTAKNGYKVSEPLAWIIANQNTFATAWLLGVWRVEETGEIVKLEA
ncbi:hypothetical protein Lpp71_02371 [Lacticaseibacillus paracasei subsp. paracasei Lpp71]|uniref:DUF1642 domain-containing protein n=1 Tax=Lacticaseibacillus paracasei subsp. paracasei Lpp71 TaxID=1256207 RepID=A0A8E0MFM3_LACPA|nr:hypothetical protein Lpp71_02371 [Lacticaseibacillus paracasei subsp. paracasei Lpp71]